MEVSGQSQSLGAKPFETHDQYFFQLNTCAHSPNVAYPGTRGCFCRLQLLLVLASEIIRRPESLRNHDHILLSQIRDSPNLEGRSTDLYLPGTGWTNNTPRHWVPFSSSHPTRRARMEVSEPASTWGRATVSVRHHC
jgi:hypothetical protein